jgi:putative phage-type endonuclease
MIRMNLDQQSDDWHRWRKGGIGSSDAPVIVGRSPWKTRKALLEYKASHFQCGFDRKTETAKSKAMLHGIKTEAEARQMYIELTGIFVEPVCGIHDSLDWCRASFDGLNERGTLITEIKCPSNIRNHEAVLAGVVPEVYYPQCQHQLLVSGAELVHFISYYSHKTERLTKAERYKIIPVRPSADYIRYLQDEETRFYNDLLELVKTLKKGGVEDGVSDEPAAGPESMPEVRKRSRAASTVQRQTDLPDLRKHRH